MKLDYFLTPYSKINSKWMENTGRILYDINHSKILYDSPPTIMEIKTKINAWGLIKLKCFCTGKETIAR